MPGEWQDEVSNTGAGCRNFTKTFKNDGLGYNSAVQGSFKGRLDVALGETMPTVRMPEFVTLVFEQENTTLEVTFTGADTVSFLLDAACDKGWVVLKRLEKDKYLGDGTNLNYSEKRVQLKVSASDNLVLHHVSVEESSTLHFFRQKEFGEYWYKFESAK